LQDTFISAYRGAAGFRGDGRVRSWLFSIARNSAMRQLRDRPTVAVDDDTMESLALAAGWGEPNSPEHMAESAERRDSLRSLLDDMSPEDRAVIVLRDLERLTGPESAEVLDLPLAVGELVCLREGCRVA